MDVGAWLRDLGLERYEQAFLDNAIDARSLPHLTAEDLAELGVGAIGHRRLLLRAIAELEPAPGTAAAGQGVRAVERRQLTVMFVDLVESTALARRLDPEELGVVMRAYHEAAAAQIGQLDGHVAKLMGDGVLACFGWPRAHEDEAERAVRAGLGIVEAVRRLEAPVPLAARVGIATGLVVVGDWMGAGAAREEVVVGDTPNLAARLQVLADAGTVVVAEATRHLLGGRFDLVDLGRHELKGFAEPVAAFRVEGESAVEGRFEARQSPVLPMVGRERELALLLDRWALACRGEGQVMLVVGEAGIGKSRLLLALREQLREEPHTALRYFCSPYHTGSALHPVARQLERAAELRRDEPAERARERLRALLGRAVSDADDAVALLAELVGISPGRTAVSPSPEERKARTFEVLVGQLEGLAARRPVLLLLEDVHWIDPTSCELFALLADRIQELPVLMVASSRPEGELPWRGHPHATTLTLGRLAREHARAMLKLVVRRRALPDGLIESMLARSEGVPLFVEELTKAVLESGVHEVDSAALAIPATLRDSLLARLDRLQDAKQIAEIGACLGREFSQAHLAAIAGRPEAELRRGLDELLRSELVFRRGLPSEERYIFKHALVRDAAYETLLRSRRQAIHVRIVEMLEGEAADGAPPAPETLARHARAAGLLDKAVGYGRAAGDAAAGRAALQEAIGHYREALAALAAVPPAADTAARELELQVALGAALISVQGYAAPETITTYARARALCDRQRDSEHLCPVLWGQYVSHLVRSELDLAQLRARELLEAAERLDIDAGRLVGHRSLGAVAFSLGRLDEAEDQLDRALAIAEPSPGKGTALGYAQHLHIVAHGYRALAEQVRGLSASAMARSRSAVEAALSTGHHATIGHALAFAGFLRHWRRDVAATLETSEALIATAGERAFAQWKAVAVMQHGWARAQAGEGEAGCREIEGGLAGLTGTGAKMWEAYFLGLLADARLCAGDWAAALEAADAGLACIEACGERLHEPELLRLRAAALRHLGHDPEADASLQRAFGVASAQGAAWWRLRAGTALARMWADQGRPAEARALLAPVHASFTDGFELTDMQEAATLLGALD